MTEHYDTIIQNGLFFDGRGAKARVANVGIVGDKVAAIREAPLPSSPETRVIDATGLWVTPGFIDLHTHYDAEVEVLPALPESLRHGVTSVVMGSCSLSLALGTPEDLSDMFCRVEAIPDEIVRPLLEEKKTWDGHRAYFEHLESLPLGPNVASFVGHSAIRAHVMGMERSLDKNVRPSEGELRRMEEILNEGLEEGYLGLSIQTLPWDKVGGDRPFRSRPLPSTFGRWSEYRRLTRILRERGKVFQGVPNVSTKVNVALFLLESIGIFRKPLKTTVISMMDVRYDRRLYKLTSTLSRLVNTRMGGNFRWQALPELFDLWSDGIDLVVFEEFGAGAAALHLREEAARVQLFSDPSYRKRFKWQWKSPLLPKVFHRDFNQSEILNCPDERLVGKSFAAIAEEEGRDVVDVFLDLVAKHGKALRWYTIMANDRRNTLEEIVGHPDVLIGFSDAGAHLRNMAHYNFPLRMLRLVKDAIDRGESFMTLERAVERLTGEIADWLGMDAGVLDEGKRADLVLVDPAGLDDSVDVAAEEAVPEYGGLVRLVRRNDKAVKAVFVNGRQAVRDGAPVPEVGKERGFGRVLRASQA